MNVEPVWRWRLAIGYALLVLFVGIALFRVEATARHVENEAFERSALLERESILRANNLCVNSNELRSEIREYLDQFGGSFNGAFAQQECPPPPSDMVIQDG
jgi:hypothetical protein